MYLKKILLKLISCFNSKTTKLQNNKKHKRLKRHLPDSNLKINQNILFVKFLIKSLTVNFARQSGVNGLECSLGDNESVSLSCPFVGRSLSRAGTSRRVTQPARKAR